MSRNSGLAILHAAALLAVFGCPPLVFAQGGLPPPAHPDQVSRAPGTLDAALPQVALDPDEFALTVGADSLTLPDDAPTPGPHDSLEAIAVAFGQCVRRFGAVQAVAPATMTVLNTDLQPPQIYDGLQPGDALKLLAATLTPAQWDALTGKQGLGMADLSDPDQQSLFRACIGTETMHIYPIGEGNAQTMDAADVLPLARLRLGAHTEVELPTSDHSWRGGGLPDSATGTPHYSCYSDQSQDATLYGNVLKKEGANTPKPGDLDFAAPMMRTRVPLAGLKTVGDLVTRAGTLTKTELYADPHYAGKSLTFDFGSASGAAAQGLPAGDLLRALAFCLTATYRRVGPAYVLTDDLAGVGVRRLLFSDLDALAQRLRQKPLDDAGDAITAQHGLADLHPFDGADQAPTPDEVKQAQNSDSMGDTPGMYLHLSFADLTPAQQAAARTIAAQPFTQSLGSEEQHAPSLQGTLLLVTQPKLELLLPSVPGPIDMGGFDMWSLFRPSQKTMNARIQAQMQAREKAAVAPRAADPPPKATPPPTPTLAQEFLRMPSRAALVDARTPADVDAAVASLKALGLNQLWLPVFTDGAARIAGTPFSATGRGPDLLAEAHRATQGTGIAVYAVLDLLKWGPDAPDAVQDLTLRGDNSAQAALRQMHQYQDMQDGGSGGPVALSPAQQRQTVSPFAPDTRTALQSLVRAVGAEPGVAGIVWRETAPSGYASSQDGGGDTFGYSVDGRLAFLRHAHVDPIDIDSSWTRADSRLPNWDGQGSVGGDDWGRFRAEADERLLRALLLSWAATGKNGVRRPVFVQQRRDSWQGDWFGSWDGPRSPLPAYYPPWQQQRGGPAYPEEPVRQAKAESQTALLRVDSWAASSRAALASYLGQQFKDPVKAPWDGFVLEFGGPNDSGINSLHALAGSP